MTPESTSASQWRIELALELTPYYDTHDGIGMILLGGSPSRGLADRYSDLDIVVYWSRIDLDWLEAVPLRDTKAERAALRKMGPADVYIEQYYFGTLKVDFGHATFDLWKQIVESVTERHETTGSSQKALAGFLAAIPLYGAAVHEEWKQRIGEYPAPLGVKMVRQHLRFFVRGCLLHQGHGRGDVLFYQDGLCRMLRNLLGIWAGLNRVWFSTDEPRWLEYEISRMPLRPPDVWARMQAALAAPPAEAVAILDRLILDTLDLVDEHLPEVDTATARQFYGLAVEGCDVKPVIR